MVEAARTPLRAGRLRGLNVPKPITVVTARDGLRPVAITRHGKQMRVESILDCWRIDDEWWRDEIQRIYYQVQFPNGHVTTVYHDLLGDIWYEQHAAPPAPTSLPVPVAISREMPTAHQKDKDQASA